MKLIGSLRNDTPFNWKEQKISGSSFVVLFDSSENDGKVKVLMLS